MSFLLACGETDGPSQDGACAATADCPSGEECSGPNDPQACGIPPTENCASDLDCGTGTTCHTIADNCSPDGFGSECVSACTDGDCPTDFDCVAGACRPTSCEDGIVCPSHQVCDPSASTDVPAYDRTPGCVNVVCDDDAACGSGACVNGFCQEGPGVCVEPIAVP